MKKVDKGNYHTDRYECELCGHVASYGTMLKHEGGPTCTSRLATNEMEAQMMDQIHDPGLIKAITKAGIELEKRPARYMYFAPGWVSEAIASYNKHGKYAGLSLTEYLKKMKPE